MTRCTSEFSSDLIKNFTKFPQRGVYLIAQMYLFIYLMLLSKQTKMSIRSERWAQLWLYRTTSVSPTSFFDVTQEPLCVCYPFLQLLHKADGIAECLPLLTGQRLQVQDGLRALSLEDADGLQQSLITDTKGGEVRQQLRGGGEGDISIIQLDTCNGAVHQTFRPQTMHNSSTALRT